MIHGTWQQTGAGGAGVPSGLVMLAVYLGAGIGAFFAVYTFVMSVLPLLFIAGLVLVLAAVGGRAAFAVYRHRHPEAAGRLHAAAVPPVRVYVLGDEPKRALPAPQVVNHFYGGQHYHAEDRAVPVVRGEMTS